MAGLQLVLTFPCEEGNYILGHSLGLSYSGYFFTISREIIAVLFFFSW